MVLLDTIPGPIESGKTGNFRKEGLFRFFDGERRVGHNLLASVQLSAVLSFARQ
jgi:hypothetical protein